MNISVNLDVSTLARTVRFEGERMIVILTDEREVSVPINWYPRLARATPQQRDNWRLIGDGEGIHWPDVDEDLPVAGILLGLKPPPTLAPKLH
ncbi:MAG: DUF2442 domain-containing protein [Chloroflexi bacterium]|nr:DUF2442 domain-containing protein [Chloroflexota bacterium]MBI3761941.1 DUF2442 domain-containing protein [Chloroflexota bacterium]